jgi:hypothetical protein
MHEPNLYRAWMRRLQDFLASPAPRLPDDKRAQPPALAR